MPPQWHVNHARVEPTPPANQSRVRPPPKPISLEIAGKEPKDKKVPVRTRPPLDNRAAKVNRVNPDRVSAANAAKVNPDSADRAPVDNPVPTGRRRPRPGLPVRMASKDRASAVKVDKAKADNAARVNRDSVDRDRVVEVRPARATRQRLRLTPRCRTRKAKMPMALATAATGVVAGVTMAARIGPEASLGTMPAVRTTAEAEEVAAGMETTR